MPVDRDMLLGRRDTLQRQLTTHRKTLWHLEEQQASYGLSTPPHIAIGIEDEREAIKHLEAELAEIKGQLEQLPAESQPLAEPAVQPQPAPVVASPGRQAGRPTVFISYSHKDEADKEELVSHLGVLQGEGLVEVWVDDRIGAGSDWAADINQAMSHARVAILLVTKNFLNSKFILQTEVPRLLERRKSEGVTVFPVIARPCAWRRVQWLAQMNVRPKNGDPVWREGGRFADDELAAIAEEVADIIKRASRAG
ncbi:MAG: toll/interleukin-1 receptor domain-containing protein [Chloroflexota bacterium]